jgi:hypothetical protein
MDLVSHDVTGAHAVYDMLQLDQDSHFSFLIPLEKTV